MTPARVMTIGHSTRPLDEFLELLAIHGVTGVADVRTIPKSRRHPHFAREALEATLGARGLAYAHFPDLGGLRKPRADSVNGGWRHPGFRAYADHMQTDGFREALHALLAFASERLTAVMCAEAKWWQCHRQLIADALTARGVEVRHILSRGEPPIHELTPFARLDGTRLTYPALI